MFGYRYLGDDGTDCREILHDGTYWFWTQSLPFWERYPQKNPKISNVGPKKPNIPKTVSRNVTFQLELKSIGRQLSKHV